MALTKNTILSHKEIEHKIKRIAYQIYESNVDETELIIAGIDSNGYLFAKKIKNNLDKISAIKSTLCKVTIDKAQPTNPILTSIKKEEADTNVDPSSNNKS